MLCKSCHYPLKQLSEPRCPECGREFDASDPKTFSSAPLPGPKLSHMIVIAAILYVVGFAALFLDTGHVRFLGYLRVLDAAIGALRLALWFAPISLAVWAVFGLGRWVRNKL